jgi:hypothetical protein
VAFSFYPVLDGGRGRRVNRLITTMKGEAMNSYKYEITQVNTYEFTIDADSQESAREIFEQYLVEDFGNPVSSHLTYEDPIEIMEGVSA